MNTKSCRTLWCRQWQRLLKRSPPQLRPQPLLWPHPPPQPHPLPHQPSHGSPFIKSARQVSQSVIDLTPWWIEWIVVSYSKINPMLLSVCSWVSFSVPYWNKHPDWTIWIRFPLDPSSFLSSVSKATFLSDLGSSHPYFSSVARKSSRHVEALCYCSCCLLSFNFIQRSLGVFFLFFVCFVLFLVVLVYSANGLLQFSFDSLLLKQLSVTFGVYMVLAVESLYLI